MAAITKQGTMYYMAAEARTKTQRIKDSMRKAFKQARKTLAKRIDKACTAVRNEYGRYVVVDSYGTGQVEWTLRKAQEWLPYCGMNACIVDTWNGSKVVCRVKD